MGKASSKSAEIRDGSHLLGLMGKPWFPVSDLSMPPNRYIYIYVYIYIEIM